MTLNYSKNYVVAEHLLHRILGMQILFPQGV